MSIIKKGIIAATLAATALVSTASPVMARDHYRRHDNTTGIAIGAGVIGLAVGALIASSSNDHDRDSRYYDRRYDARDGRYYPDTRYDNQARGWDQYRDWQRRSPDYDRQYYARRGY